MELESFFLSKGQTVQTFPPDHASFGRLSREQRLMLFAGEDLNNTRNYKTGQGIALIDGQEGATEIIVPWIHEQDILLKRIRNYMDRQPSIQELLHQIQSTGGVAEHKP